MPTHLPSNIFLSFNNYSNSVILSFLTLLCLDTCNKSVMIWNPRYSGGLCLCPRQVTLRETHMHSWQKRDTQS